MKNEHEEAIKGFLSSEDIRWDIKPEEKKKALELIRSLDNPSKFTWGSSRIIEAMIGPGFQEYAHEGGKRVIQGEAIGIEVPDTKGEWQLLLFDGIFFSSEPDNYGEGQIEELAESLGLNINSLSDEEYWELIEDCQDKEEEEIKEIIGGMQNANKH